MTRVHCPLRFALVVLASFALVSCGGGDAPAPEPVEAGPDVVATRALREPKVIRSDGDSIDYALVVKMKTWRKTADELVLVPGDTPADNEMRLRTYGSPKDYARATDAAYLADDANLDWTIPGPTFRIRHGQGFNLKLINRLPLPGIPDDQCNEGSPAEDVYPDCFHGNNTTNMHFHGFRVSPERPQDWVFLMLRPEGSEPVQDGADVVVGEFDFQIAPLRDIQPVGTHWYHPHKHGSTAIQVVNGMAGAFVVEGYFDDYLRDAVPGLQEKTLVLQQINPSLPLAGTQKVNDKSLWVNGQKNPVIQVARGEVQRWRFVGANQQASADMVLSFDGMAVRQIAQDGVPFADENYQSQPLDLSRPGALLREVIRERLPEGSAFHARLDPDVVGAGGPGTSMMHLGPGNRVDVLVQAPMVAGDYPITLQKASGDLATELREGMAAAGADEALVTLRVTDEENPMTLPGALPDLPPYLADIPQPVERTTVEFHMSKGAGPGPVPPEFFIDGKKFDPERIDHTVQVGRDEQWTLTNTAGSPEAPATPVAHPFHIHVNPFQLVTVNGRELPKPWIWWDTLTLPTHSDAGVPGEGSAVIFQRFMEFTGQYVLHCHILGHEDRGMMQNVLAREGQ